MAMIRIKIKAYIKKCTLIFLTVFTALYIFDAYITNYGNPLPDSLDPKSIGIPIYPYGTNMCSWSKEEKPESDLSIGLTNNSPYADYFFEYDVPETGADSILNFYSAELSKRGWKIEEKPEKSCDAEYHIMSFLVIYIKHSMRLYLRVFVYERKPNNFYWYFKKSVPTDVRICIYK